jgi:hypothetical protein
LKLAATAGPTPANSLSISPLQNVGILMMLLNKLVTQCCLDGPTMKEVAAGNRASQPPADFLAAVLGGPRTDKERQLLKEYSPPTGQHLVQLLSISERFVRLLPAAAASGNLPLVVGLQSGQRHAIKMVTGPLMDPVDVAGPHSPEQQQLHSLMFSLLKLHNSSAMRNAWPNEEARLLHASMGAVCRVLESQLLPQAAARRVQGIAGGTHHNGSSNSSTVMPGAVASSRAQTEDASPVQSSNMLPVLVLFGRCCLSLATSLETSQSVIMPLPAEELQGRPGLHTPRGTPNTLLNFATGHTMTWFNQDSNAQEVDNMGPGTHKQLRQKLNKLFQLQPRHL